VAAARAGLPTNSVYTSRMLKHCPTEFEWVQNPQLEDGVLYLLSPETVATSPTLTALARRSGELQHARSKQSFYAVHAEPKLFFEPRDFSGLLADPQIIGLHISPKGRGGEKPVPGSLYAWAAERFS